ncbi:Ribonuclease H2 subunit B [Mactra antiquata]
MPATRKNKICDSDDETEDIESTSVKKYVRQDVSQWIFMINDEAIKYDPNGDSQFLVCGLKHPRTGKKCLYLFNTGSMKIYEITQFKEEFRSWLIDETVQNDSSIYITTPIDPVFLVLPYLIKTADSGRYMTLDQVIIDENYPECARLVDCCSDVDLEKVADIKGSGDIKAYRYNKEKTLSWLKIKTERVSVTLNDKDICVISGVKASELVKAKASNEEYMRYAHGLVSDYLPSELSSSLREYLGIPALAEKRPSDAGNPPNKRTKLEDITPNEDYSKNVKIEEKTSKGKQSIAQKKLDKVDKKGMKSMMSFFSPKSK